MVTTCKESHKVSSQPFVSSFAQAPDQSGGMMWIVFADVETSYYGMIAALSGALMGTCGTVIGAIYKIYSMRLQREKEEMERRGQREKEEMDSREREQVVQQNLLRDTLESRDKATAAVFSEWRIMCVTAREEATAVSQKYLEKCQAEMTATIRANVAEQERDRLRQELATIKKDKTS